MVIFGEGGKRVSSCPCHGWVLALEHVELFYFMPPTAWAFAYLMHVCQLFTCVEPVIEHLGEV